MRYNDVMFHCLRCTGVVLMFEGGKDDKKSVKLVWICEKKAIRSTSKDVRLHSF